MLKGVLFSLCASALFGYLFYFSTLLQPLSGEGVFGWRIVFTLPFLCIALIIFRQQQAFKNLLLRIRQKPWLLGAIALNGCNMGLQMWLFLWAPSHGSSIATSLGYLLLPLIMVLAGRLIFREKISKLKALAVAIAGVGVGTNILLQGGLSWESMIVAGGYVFYFIIRKKLNIVDFSAFVLEILCVLPVSLFFIWQTDLKAVELVNPNIMWLLPILGLLSGIAMLSYIYASNLLPVNLFGLLGYAEPLNMLLVAFILGEKIDAARYPLFISLIIAMMLLVADGISSQKRRGIS